ncbi:ROK family protein, partial [Salmonella enterica subsp. enterica serovar Kentucky]|nr:ROK family protein [Salmonella enterica subsp. enterica serovar Kentucky]
DDALSAVDGRTEHQILHNLRQWGEGRTVIISAHRLSALTDANAQAAAWAEYHALPDDIRDMVFITVSTGVGGGVVCDGKLLTGK